jgi:multidrug efflux pump subunit AcrA (membrane-fusion protein)
MSSLLKFFRFKHKIIILNILIIFSLIIQSCSKPIDSIKPKVGLITESVYASGIIKSKNQYMVYSTVAGIIQSVLVKKGDVVKKGDPLFIIKNETSKINTENAKISTEFANRNINGDKVNELKNAIENAKSKLLNDSLLLTRQKELWDQQVGSKFDLEQRELAFTNSKNNYLSAIFRLNDLKKQLNFNAEQSKKQLAISKTIAKDYTIRSLVDGKIYSITKEQGELVSSQSPIAIIGNSDNFSSELQVDEEDIVQVKIGQVVFLSLDSYKGEVFEGLVNFINPIMNDRTKTFTVEIEFTKQPPQLFPNLTTEANIVIAKKENAITIPRSYLIDDSLVLMENKEKRKIEIGLKDFERVEILSGIKSEETIMKPTK